MLYVNAESCLIERYLNLAVILVPTTFIIRDNMKVVRSTPGSIIVLLREFGIVDVNILEEKFLRVGPEEVLILLERIMVSETLLTRHIFASSRIEVQEHVT